MDRLYYESPDQHFGFSIGKAPEGMHYSENIPHPRVKGYLEKVAKLVPSEILAAYITMTGFVSSIRSSLLHRWLYISIFVLCLALTPFYLNFQAIKHKPKIVHLSLSSFAFIIWAYTISGEKIFPSFYDPAIASILLVSFSIISGLIPLKR